jgi:hypothetical protein
MHKSETSDLRREKVAAQRPDEGMSWPSATAKASIILKRPLTLILFRKGRGRLPCRARPWTAAAALLLSASPAAADPLAKWLDALETCAPARPLALAVVGVEPTQTALSREQAEEVRLTIESRLQATGRAKLAAAADVVRIKGLREGTTGLSAEEAEAQIRAAFSVDASVFFAEPQRDGGKATLRLLGVGSRADCKATSEPIEVPVREGPGLADIDQLFSGAVRSLAQSAPDATSVTVCPFRAASGHSTCGAALADRLTIALDAEARSPNRVLKGGTLEVNRAAEGACEAGGDNLVALGGFDHDRAGQSWMSLEFRRGGAVLAPVGRRKISIEALGCDPSMRPFLDHIAATAATDRARLDVAALQNPFSRGQRLDVRIASTARQKLYCWVLAPDETGFVALPVRGSEAADAPGDRRYPRSFGLSEIVLAEPFENLFSCFAAEYGLPEAIEKRWMAAAPGADGDAKLLSRGDILDLMEQIRATPGVREATTRIVVR